MAAEVSILKDQLSKLDECVKKKAEELSKIQTSKTEEVEDLKKNFQEQMEAKDRSIENITSDASQASLRLKILEKDLAELKVVIANKDEEIKNLSEKTSGKSRHIHVSFFIHASIK